MPTPPHIKGGTEVYDAIMQAIEPDLLSTNVGSLDEKYNGESESEKQERMQRYARAIVEYEKKYKDYLAGKRTEIRTFGRDSVRMIERAHDTKEEKTLSSLESEISQAA